MMNEISKANLFPQFFNYFTICIISIYLRPLEYFYNYNYKIYLNQ